MTDNIKDMVIVGAGPYGLATAAYAKHCGLDYVLLGKPMELWRSHMLDNMMLRSPIDWHMDPTDRYTISRFFELAPRDREQTAPLTRIEFLKYVDWFMKEQGIVAKDLIVERITKAASGTFKVITSEGEIATRNVVVATGLKQFRFIPEELEWLTETGRASHSSEHVNYNSLLGKSVLIVGGRQSAYEAVKEISDSQQSKADVCHRHPTPAFTQADWEWNMAFVKQLRTNSSWFSDLNGEEQEAIQKRFWSEGREQLEPWLKDATVRPNVKIHPLTQIVRAQNTADKLQVDLSDGTELQVDHILFATGYRVRTASLKMLQDLMPDLLLGDGYPQLDSAMRSSIPGLYFTGLFCTKRFGPIFGFVLGCQVAPIITMKGMARSAQHA